MQAHTGPSRMLASETVREGTQAGQKTGHTQHNRDKHNKHEQHTNKQKAKTNKKQLLDFSSRPSQSDSDVKLSESSTTAGCASSGGAPPPGATAPTATRCCSISSARLAKHGTTTHVQPPIRLMVEGQRRSCVTASTSVMLGIVSADTPRAIQSSASSARHWPGG